jgi:hypothetical protein
LNPKRELGRNTIIRYIFSPALNIEEMFRDINAALENGIMNEELIQKLAKDYPEQETVGSPLYR